MTNEHDEPTTSRESPPPWPSTREYWRSIQELAGCAGDSAEEEFPPGADAPPNEIERRELLTLLAASLAFAGLPGCADRSREKILPHSDRPPDVIPGVPLEYATSFVLDGFALGVIAKSIDGRPIKIEGNPEHPASVGATDAYAQASVLALYDPDRLPAPRWRGVATSWEQALGSFSMPSEPGRPPWFVLYPQSSPLVAVLVRRIRERHPGARFSWVSPLSRTSGYAASRALYGRPLECQYDFARARVVLALDADFLASMPMSVRWARDFAARRRLARPEDAMNRLYVAETTFTPTGSLADHRIRVRSSEVRELAASILGELLADPGSSAAVPAGLAAALPRAERSPHTAVVRALVRDLIAARGECVVIAGDAQPVETHVLALLMNTVLGNVGATVTLTEPALLEPEGGDSLPGLIDALRSQSVGRVVILEANPVHTAPELELGRWLPRASEAVHLTYFANETSAACPLLLPLAHYLESWGDARAYDGTLSYIQPLIEPLLPARTTVEVLAAFAGMPFERGEALLRQSWQTILGPTFASEWELRLQRGFVPGSAHAAVAAPIDWKRAEVLARQAAAPAMDRGYELTFERSPSVYDGRFANNGWLLELPHPMTKQTWGNAAVMAPRTALALGVKDGSIVEIAAGRRKLRIPALLLPGHAERAVTVALGYGRAGSETLARGVGADAYPIRSAGTTSWLGNVQVTVTDETEALALTQQHWKLEERPLALMRTLGQYRKDPEFALAERRRLPTLLPEDGYSGKQWAMTIDMTICMGCNACVVACQAENNVPIVGKRGVERSREMHWLRIDRYFTGPPEAPRVVHQPMLCQHCEKAPCEYVCPVNATVHSPDGLNEMVYNRCIGTRFCSNNCPYKVRRFNWFEYSEKKDSRVLQRNPDVTVRERGVMEKCTYCVQRIRRAEIRARIERRTIRPGEVTTACAQACATGAIQFDSLDHADTAMVRWRREPRAYSALHDLGAQPRTRYLAKIENPNPELDV